MPKLRKGGGKYPALRGSEGKRICFSNVKPIIPVANFVVKNYRDALHFSNSEREASNATTLFAHSATEPGRF